MSGSNLFSLAYAISTRMRSRSAISEAMHAAYAACNRLPHGGLSRVLYDHNNSASMPFVAAFLADKTYDDFMGFWLKGGEQDLLLLMAIVKFTYADALSSTARWSFSHEIRFHKPTGMYEETGGLANSLRSFLNAYLAMSIMRSHGFRVTANIKCEGLPSLEFFPRFPPMSWLVSLATSTLGAQHWECHPVTYRTLAARYRPGGWDWAVDQLESLAASSASTAQRGPTASRRHVAVKKQ